MQRLTVGKRGEDLAASYLRKLGYAIIGRCVRCGHGEIDIIARDKKTLVFVEVKTRTNDTYGSPEESIHSRKLRNLHRSAVLYLRTHPHDADVRFDVIAVQMGNNSQPVVRHIPSAV